MTALQIKTENQTLQLQIALSKFGLNPSDWRVELRKGGKAILRHVESPEFQLIGNFGLKKQGWDWMDLTVSDAFCSVL